MASTAVIPQNDTPTSPTEQRPQAGPLPRKRGEIGFRESLHEQGEGPSNPQEHLEIPERHPADTSLPDISQTLFSNDTPQATASEVRPSSPTSPSVRKEQKKHIFSLVRFRSLFTNSKIGGITLALYFRFFAQIAVMAATLAAWVIIIKKIEKGGNVDITGNSTMSVGGSVTIFVHVAFAVGFIGQLIFLERCVFYMRAQRYLYKNPGAVLPTHTHFTPQANTVGLGFAPWNRPALPTYAAALAQSGVGTGDVEDSAIAVPPPPEYGNVRGSTLLMRGILRESQLRRSGVHDIQEEGDLRHSMGTLPSRPMSYHSRDGDSEERRNNADTDRSRQIEEALHRLEEGSQRSDNGHSDNMHSPRGQ